MKITCEKEKLIECLNMTSRVVSTRSTLPIMECILVTADDSGVRLTANEMEMSLETAPIEADIYVGGSVALEARLFSEIVRKMPGGYIDIETNEQNVTTFKSGRAKFKIMGQPGEEFPVMPVYVKTDGYTLKARHLKDMIRQTIFSVAVDETKPILMGELLQYKDHTLHIVAVDGFRISYRCFTTDADHAPMSVVVPAKTLGELSRVLPSDGDEDVIFFFTDKRIVFELPKFTFVGRLMEGEFIRYDQIFNEDCTTTLTINRLALLNSVERACLIVRENKKSPVKLDIGQTSVEITSKTDMGDVYDEVPAEIEGQTLTIAFNPRYIVEALRAIDEESIVLKFTTPYSPCTINGVTSDTFKYLILPLRVLG